MFTEYLPKKQQVWLKAHMFTVLPDSGSFKTKKATGIESKGIEKLQGAKIGMERTLKEKNGK